MTPSSRSSILRPQAGRSVGAAARVGWRGAAGMVAGAAAAFAVVGAGTASAEEDVATFVDTRDRGHEQVVELLVEEGVIVGCEDDRFCPDEPMTRGQVASVLAAALGLDDDGAVDDGTTETTVDGEGSQTDDGTLADGTADGTTDTTADGTTADGTTGTTADELPYDDIEGNLHAEAVVAIDAAGITNGCDDDIFCVDDPVTRAQFATMIDRAFEVPPTDVVSFDDAVGTHGGSMNALGAAGIAAGCGDPLTDFCGADPVLRWEAATFVGRALGLVERVDLAPLTERRAEQERIDEARRQAEQERLEQERLEQERLEQERLEQERLEQERIYAQAAAERLAMWERLAECESNGRWDINTGNGYYGGLQFHIQTWRTVGGTGYPHQASKEEQIYRAERLLDFSWATFGNQWPACSRMLGLG